MANPQAAWYPDPSHRFEFRYWDGQQWTGHVATQGVQSLDPVHSPGLPDTTVQAAEPQTQIPVGRTVETPDHIPTKQSVVARMRDEHRAKAARRDEFEAVALRAAGGDSQALQSLPGAVAQARTLYRSGQLEKKLWATMATAVRTVIADDVMTSEEEDHIHRLGEILGTPAQQIEVRDHALFEELVIAGINDGRFPRLEDPGVMLKRGEDAYGSFSASLMKEQAVREFRGGSQSVSVPLGAGLRYRVGGFRGRSVLIGSELVVQDAGELFVTSQRVLFMGRAKTLEFRNDRMVGLQQYADGLRLSVSNRQTASLFKVQSPSIAAALIAASVAHST